MTLSKAQKTAIIGSLLGGGVSLLKDTIFPLDSKKKKKSWWKKLLNASIYAAGGGALGYAANKAVSKYLYNSIAQMPLGYPKTTEGLKFLLTPRGDTFGEKVKDVWHRLTNTPDAESVKTPLDIEFAKEYNDIDKGSIQQLLHFSEITGDKSALPVLAPKKGKDYDSLLTAWDMHKPDRFMNKFLPIVESAAAFGYKNSIPLRRELLARNLGVFDDSKGSAYKPVESIGDLPTKFNTDNLLDAYAVLRRSDSDKISSMAAFSKLMRDPKKGILTQLSRKMPAEEYKNLATKARNSYLDLAREIKKPTSTSYWNIADPIYARALAGIKDGNLYTADIWDFALNDGEYIKRKGDKFNLVNLARQLTDKLLSNKISIIDKQKIGINDNVLPTNLLNSK